MLDSLQVAVQTPDVQYAMYIAATAQPITVSLRLLSAVGIVLDQIECRCCQKTAYVAPSVYNLYARA